MKTLNIQLTHYLCPLNNCKIEPSNSEISIEMALTHISVAQLAQGKALSVMHKQNALLL